MKRKLLSIAMLLLASAIHAQVGIGTTIPNKSAELTLLSKDKGLLIPNIPLESTTDQTTIVNGNVESLLVYATLKQGDIEPGFYYWDKTKWMRIVGDSDVVKIVINNFHEIITNEYVQNEIKQFFEISGGNVYYDGTKFEYIDENGDRHEINMQELVKAYETLTVLGYNATTGVLTYQDEHGNTVTVDVKGAVKSFETVTSVTSDATAGTITFKDEKGIDTVLDIKQLIELNETLTVLGYNATTGVLT
ncbi:hypothetical protein HX004_16000, partial [Myroides sp. 1354]|nr:hypothetical protein [Myroides sp. R163-1]MDM1057262.1 hypothetical protein [Myroides sp. 1354]MDM1070503.1 hypothetical protein [Myroides sp. 1372]